MTRFFRGNPRLLVLVLALPAASGW